MASYYPQELIISILLKLPPKSLLRFRCVSKEFCSFIDDPCFARSHLDKSLESESRDVKVLLSGSSMYTRYRSFHLTELNSKTPKHNRTINLHNVAPPFKYFPNLNGFRVLGSLHGLLCIQKGESLYVLNVSIRKRIKLPPPLSHLCSSFYTTPDRLNFSFTRTTYGFGYDSKIKDYKAVLIEHHYVGPFGSDQVHPINIQITVCNLGGQRYWRSVECEPRAPADDFIKSDEAKGVFFRGALHWVAWVGRGNRNNNNNNLERRHVLVAFDVEQERFKKVSGMPYDISDETGVNITTMEVLGDWLSCMYRRTSGPLNNEEQELWVMKEYGTDSSWTKLLSIQIRGVLRALSHSKCGNRVLLLNQIISFVGNNNTLENSTDLFMWYDLTQKTIEPVRNIPERLRLASNCGIFNQATVILDSVVNPRRLNQRSTLW